MSTIDQLGWRPRLHVDDELTHICRRFERLESPQSISKHSKSSTSATAVQLHVQMRVHKRSGPPAPNRGPKTRAHPGNLQTSSRESFVHENSAGSSDTFA